MKHFFFFCIFFRTLAYLNTDFKDQIMQFAEEKDARLHLIQQIVEEENASCMQRIKESSLQKAKENLNKFIEQL